MYKKTQLAALVVPLLTALLIVGSTFLAGHFSALAHPLDFNPAPPTGSCEVAYNKPQGVGGGKTPLVVSQVQDPGLAKTLGDYNLWCDSGISNILSTGCTLVPGGNSSGDTPLSLANIANNPEATYIYSKLNGAYGLDCHTTPPVNNNSQNASGFQAGTLYEIQSGLPSSPLRYLDIPNPGNTAPDPVVADSLSSPSTPSQLWTFVSAGQGGFFYIQSQSGFFLSFGGAQDGSTVRLVSALEQGSSILPSELWKFVSNGASASTGYIQSEVRDNKNNALVLDIPNSNPALNTQLIVFPQDQPTANNQLWTLVPAPS